jgi:hypothetical protein
MIYLPKVDQLQTDVESLVISNDHVERLLFLLFLLFQLFFCNEPIFSVGTARVNSREN